MRRHPISLITAFALGTTLFSTTTVGAADADRSLSEFAGGAGAGQATNLAMSARDIATYGDLAYVIDDQYGVIRRIDLISGVSEVVVGGGGAPGSAGALSLGRPEQLAVDPTNGDLYVADTRKAIVLRAQAVDGVVTADSRIEIAAGNRERVLSSDGQQATEVALVGPHGVAVDGQGNLFISEPSQDRVRMVSPDGTISTVAGLDRPIADGPGFGKEDCVEMWPAADCADDGLPSYPLGLAVGTDGTLYVADFGTDSVRQLQIDDAGQGMLVPVAGGEVFEPQDVAVAEDGDIIVVTGDRRVLRIGPNGVHTLLDAGEKAKLTGASAYGLDPLVAADEQGRLLKITSDGVTTIAGNGRDTSGGDGGAALDAQLNLPNDIAYDDRGNVYFLDEAGGSIRRIDCAGRIDTISRFPDPIVIGSAQPQAPKFDRGAVALAPSGSIYVQRVTHWFRHHNDGNLPIYELVAIAPDGSEEVLAPRFLAGFSDGLDLSGMAVAPDGRIFFTMAAWPVWAFDPKTGGYELVVGKGSGYSGDGGPAKEAELRNPSALAFDAAGNLYIAEEGNDIVRMVDTRGIISTITGVPPGPTPSIGAGESDDARSADIGNPQDIVVTEDGLYILDDQHDRVLRVRDGRVETLFGSMPVDYMMPKPVPGGLGVSVGVNDHHLEATVDPYGGNASVNDRYVGVEVDAENGRADLVTERPTGSRTALADPTSLAVAEDGNILVIESARNRFQSWPRRTVDRIRLIPGQGEVSSCETPEPTTLSYVGDTEVRGGPVRLAAVLVDADGDALASQTIAFTIGGETYEATTDGTGLAETTVTMQGHGHSQDVTATFAGDETFAPATTSATIFWGASPSPHP